jgi:hypothetical protein
LPSSISAPVALRSGQADGVHYCQACDDAPLMDAHPDGIARCPRCASVDHAALQPVLVVTGASASGKTTLFPHLARELAGECIVFDTDWLIDPLGGDVTTLDWDLLRDVWLHVAHGVAQNGLPTMLLGALLPDQLDALGGRRWIRSVHHVLLDCDDDARRQRIDDRPAGRSHDVERQLAFASELRRRFTAIVDTSAGTPEHSAARVAAWARTVLVTA